MTTTLKALALAALAVTSLQSRALDFKTESGLEARVTGVLSFGTQIRTKDPNPDGYSAIVSPFVAGVPRGNLAGQNGGSDLNFYKGNQISTVLKGVVDVDVKKDNVGVFLRASAWKEFALGEKNAAYGNFPNGFTQNAPLSDSGFAPSTKFSNVILRDAFAYASSEVAPGQTLDGRLGRQILNWGGSQLLTGGVNSAINPVDLSSQLRPGALPFEGKLPLGMLNVRLASTNAWNVEGFAAYEHRGNVYPGCGTYFDVASFIATGCNMISFAGASEQQRFATDQYVHRTPDITPDGLGSYGLSLGFRADTIGTDLRLYAMNTTSVAPSYRMTVNSTTAASAGNSNYGLIYPEHVAVYGLSFNKKIGTTFTNYGELAYRPNQPISFNASDLLGAFFGRSPSSLLALRKGITAIPVGGTFDAYDRFAVTTGSMGINMMFPKALGADRVALTAEIGFSHINALPSQDMIRFGRGTAYGAAPYVGATGALTACTEAVGGKQCTADGYTSSNAWGLRLLASAAYPNAMAGTTLTPSILIAKDIDGYSFDGTFSKGRTLVRPSVRAEWGKAFHADLQFNKFMDGKYNLLVDRDYLSVVVGTRF